MPGLNPSVALVSLKKREFHPKSISSIEIDKIPNIYLTILDTIPNIYLTILRCKEVRRTPVVNIVES